MLKSLGNSVFIYAFLALSAAGIPGYVLILLLVKLFVPNSQHRLYYYVLLVFVALSFNSFFHSEGIKIFRYIVSVLILYETRATLQLARNTRMALLIILSGVFVTSLFSVNVYLSLLKVTSFFLLSVSTIAAISNMDFNVLRKLFEQVIILSAIHFFAGLLNGSVFMGQLFQGPFIHPQTAGPLFVLFLVVVLQLNLFPKARLVMVLSLIFLVGITLSRTSFVSLAAVLLMYSRTVLKIVGNRSISGLFGIVLVAVMTSVISTNANTKSNEGETLREMFRDSRGQKYNMSLQNFYDNPIAGIGLGVPSNFREKSVGISMESGVEKGVLYTAILEEQGLIGAIGFVMFILIAFNNGYFSNLSGLGLVSILLLNFGEATFFSYGPLGFMEWLILAVVFTGKINYKS